MAGWTWSISGVEPERAADIAEWAVEQGFRAMKVKVGIDPEQDVARVAAVRKVLGPLRLGIDANGAWNVATAVRMIRRLQEYEIAFAEQPIAPGNVEALAEVRRTVAVPIVADERSTRPPMHCNSRMLGPPMCSRSTSANPQASVRRGR